MKDARAEDVWRNLAERSPPISLRAIEVVSAHTGEVTVVLDPSLTVLAGLNGSGKTTILMGIARVLGLDPAVCAPQALPSDLRVRLTVVNAAKAKPSEMTLEWTADQTNLTSHGFHAEFMDPSRSAWLLRERYEREGDLGSLLEGIEPQFLKDKHLKEVSYLVGREYDLCEVFEIEMADGAVVPYFRVSLGERPYGAEAMGGGELAAHYLLWRLRSLRKPGVLLVEEPESLLSPHAQRRLARIFAHYTHQLRLCTVLTTHSAALLDSVPHEYTRVITRSSGRVVTLQARRTGEAIAMIGAKPETRVIAVVEDQVAVWYAIAWLRSYDSSLLREVELVFHPRGASGAAEAGRIPRTRRGIRVISLLDGDQEGKEDGKEAGRLLAFLPGDVAPDQQVVNLLKAMPREEAADLLQSDADELTAAFAATEGMDYHDALHRLAISFGTSAEALVSRTLSSSSPALRDWHVSAAARFERLLELLR